MKKNRGLKLTLIILIIILLSLISFVGIYVQNKNEMDNILPNYKLGRDLSDYRIVEFKVSDEKNTINYDAEGKEIAVTDTETKVASTEEKALNPEEVLTVENYKTSKKIVEKRLDKMGITDYSIKQNNENGTIIVELPNSEYTEYEATQLALKGKFEVVDDETQEVLMTNNDIQFVKAGYGRNSSGNVVVYINFQFNKEGTQKLKNITNTYVQTTVTKDSTEGQAQTTENSVTTTTEETEAEPQTENVTKQIAIKVDDSEILTTHFGEEISNGLLQLTLGSGITTTKELQENMQQATGLAAELDSGIMPIIYETNKNEVITTSVTSNKIKTIITISVAILAVALIFIIIKYKVKGVLAAISLIGYIAVFLLAVRYFNVEISIDGILGILVAIAVSYGIIICILKNEEVTKTVGKCTVALIPALIIAISLTFANLLIGLTLFWGLSIALLYHISISNLMLKD